MKGKEVRIVVEKREGNKWVTVRAISTEGIEQAIRNYYEQHYKDKLPFWARFFVGAALGYIGELLAEFILWLAHRK